MVLRRDAGSLSGKALQAVAVEQHHPVVRIGGEAEHAVEVEGVPVEHVHCKAQVGSVPRLAGVPQGGCEECASRAAAARGAFDVQVLHVQAARAAPGGELGKVNDDADVLAILGCYPGVIDPGVAEAETLQPRDVGGKRRGVAERLGETAEQAHHRRQVLRRSLPDRGSVHCVMLPARIQNVVWSAPLSFSIRRASAGVATARPSSSTMRRTFRTCSALDSARRPRAMKMLSSSPTRTWPPMLADAAAIVIWWRPAASTENR